jgi:hypothetical protein
MKKFFRETEGIKMLVKIFLHHTRSFWKQPEKLAWLESTSTDFISNLTKEIRAEAKQWKEK